MLLKNVYVEVSQTKTKQPLNFFWKIVWGRSSDLSKFIRVVESSLMSFYTKSDTQVYIMGIAR